MPPDAPEEFARARERMLPAMRASVDRLSPRIRRVVRYHLGWIDPDGNPVAHPGGKAVRPALAYASAEAVGADADVATPAAVAVELVHNFSLLHDDVMDRDTERRHRPTAWALMGEGEAILAGDALLALAQERLIDPPTDERLAAAAALSEATADMITGQAEDLSFESRDDVTVDECVAMLTHKTAALLACACRMGALLGSAGDAQVAAVTRFGLDLGLAFQAVDDVLGIWGDPQRTGKPAFGDLRQHKKSLPVVAAMEAAGPAADAIGKLFRDPAPSDADLATVADLIERDGGRDRAMGIATEAYDAALRHLSSAVFPESPLGHFEAIASFITDREY